MNQTILSKFLIFAAGAAIGSAVTWKLLKTKYEQIAQEEIESVKEVFSKKASLEYEHVGEPIGDVTKVEVTDEGVKAEVTLNKKSQENYRSLAKQMTADLGYTNYSNISKTEEGGTESMEYDKPYVISPDEFDELDDYETVSLTFYSDCVLTDDQNNPIEDVEGIVGIDFYAHFGEYEDDSVFIRNDRTKCDYEILMDYRKYSDVV